MGVQRHDAVEHGAHAAIARDFELERQRAAIELAAGEIDVGRREVGGFKASRPTKRTDQRSGRGVEIEIDGDQRPRAAADVEPAALDDKAVKRDAATPDLQAPARKVDAAIGPARERQRWMIEPRQGEARAPRRQAGERRLKQDRLADERVRAARRGGDGHVLEHEIGGGEKADFDRPGDRRPARRRWR